MSEQEAKQTTKTPVTIDVDANGFHKLQHVNDWGVDGWFLWLTSHPGDMSGQDQSVRLRDGTKVEVKWPEGTVSKEVIVAKKEIVTVGDMGHTYKTTTERLYVSQRVNGVEWFVDISRNPTLRFKILA